MKLYCNNIVIIFSISHNADIYVFSNRQDYKMKYMTFHNRQKEVSLYTCTELNPGDGGGLLQPPGTTFVCATH